MLRLEIINQVRIVGKCRSFRTSYRGTKTCQNLTFIFTITLKNTKGLR